MIVNGVPKNPNLSILVAHLANYLHINQNSTLKTKQIKIPTDRQTPTC